MDVASSPVEDLSLHMRTGDWLSDGSGSFYDTSGYFIRTLIWGFPRLTALSVQGFDMSTEHLIDIVDHHDQLRKIHFHAFETHSPEPKYGIAIAGRHGFKVKNVCEWSELTSLKGVLVPPCTEIELIHGQNTWTDIIDAVRDTYDPPY
jgi:hypothetical protein